MVISVICLIFTGIVYWMLISKIRLAEWSYVYIVCLYSLVSEMMCFAGALERYKCLLIPLMVGMCQTVVGCAMWLILSIYCWAIGSYLEGMTVNSTLLSMILLISIIFGPSIYVLVIVVKFYNELTAGVVAGQVEGVALDP